MLPQWILYFVWAVEFFDDFFPFFGLETNIHMIFFKQVRQAFLPRLDGETDQMITFTSNDGWGMSWVSYVRNTVESRAIGSDSVVGNMYWGEGQDCKTATKPI